MNKAKIYIPTKNSMQSGLAKTNMWVIEYETKEVQLINHSSGNVLK